MSLAVELDRASVRYPDGRGIENLTARLEAGRTVALVGPSGAGKSTLARLIRGSRRPGSGQVTIGGVDPGDLSAEQLRDLVSVIPQHTTLFRRSLLDNLRIARPDATREQLEAAASAAHLSELIASLPEGWHTPVGERGATLSGGEAQRVAIARALLRDTPVVVLDEITSHLDAHSEREVQRALAPLLAGRTVLVIAHRLRTVRTADHIVVLEAGRVVGAGAHDQLLDTCEVYERLWSSQQIAARWRLVGHPARREVSP